jgi:cytochrome b pre-mRNA-processing protein 3
MGIWPFRASQAKAAAERILTAVTAASRQPGWFGEGKLADSLEGRFEAMAANASLALLQLKDAPEVAQLFTDALFSLFDAGLREAGVGDLTVPKRMHKLAGEFYGRLDAYGRALAGPPGDLEAALQRNMGLTEPFSARLAGHLRATAKSQQGLRPEALGEPSAWPLFAG